MRSQRFIILSILTIASYKNLIHKSYCFVINNNNAHFSENRKIIINRQFVSSTTENSYDILTATEPNENAEETSLIGIKSLGVDYGTVRTGVAVTVGYAPIPLTILNSQNTTELARDIVKLSQSEKATQIVIGLPLHKNGTISEQANIVQNFSEAVACTVYKTLGPNSTNVYLFDERYSSKEAIARILSTTPAKDHNKQYIIDADSACIILEHFYAVNGVGKHLVTIPNHLKQECDDAWSQQERENKERQQRILDDRTNALNARREMIKRVQMETSQTSTSRKKKKKNKKRKASNWIVL